MYKKNQLKPLCRTSRGCPIEDVAPVISINKRCDKFRMYKALSETNTPESVLIRLMKEANVYDDLNVLISAEVIYSKSIKKEIDKRNRKRK